MVRQVIHETALRIADVLYTSSLGIKYYDGATLVGQNLEQNKSEPKISLYDRKEYNVIFHGDNHGNYVVFLENILFHFFTNDEMVKRCC